MQITPAGKIPYTEKQFNAFKERLALSLIENGIDTEDVQRNAEYKNYIANYVQSEFADKDIHHIIAGITHKFAHTEINSSVGKKVYPTINVYNGHHLQKTIYFKKDFQSNEIKAEIIEVNPKKILL